MIGYRRSVIDPATDCRGEAPLRPYPLPARRYLQHATIASRLSAIEPQRDDCLSAIGYRLSPIQPQRPQRTQRDDSYRLSPLAPRLFVTGGNLILWIYNSNTRLP